MVLSFRPNARKSEGGVKLLDITEQPVNAMARKRKRQQEMEEAAAEKKKAQEQRAAEKQVRIVHMRSPIFGRK